MKFDSRARLSAAAFSLAFIAAALAAQASDPGLVAVRQLNEAIKFRDEGKMQLALDKLQEILNSDPENEGALALKQGIADAIAEAAKAAEAAKPAPAPSVPSAPAPSGTQVAEPTQQVPLKPIQALAEEHRRLYQEVEWAIQRARSEADRGDFDKALGTLDGAMSSLPGIASANEAKKKLTIARQEISMGKDSVDPRRDSLFSKAAKDVQERLDASRRTLSNAESLVRKGDSKSLEDAKTELLKAERSLPSSIASDSLKERIGVVRAGVLARLALLAIDSRQMTQADGYITDLEKLGDGKVMVIKARRNSSQVELESVPFNLGVGSELLGQKVTALNGRTASLSGVASEDIDSRKEVEYRLVSPAASRLREEFTALSGKVTFQNVDTLSPGFRQKEERVGELLVRGRARYLYGDYQGAIEAYREVLQYQPGNAEAKAYQVRIREILAEHSGQWNRGVTKGKLLELLDESWKLPEVFNKEVAPSTTTSFADPLIERLRSIKIPSYSAPNGMPLDAALKVFADSVQTYDKEQKPLNISVFDPERKNPPINLEMKEITADLVLDNILRQASFTYIVNRGVIEVRPDSGSNDLETEFFQLNDGAVKKITNVGGAAASAAAPANPFGGGGGGATAGVGESPQEIGIKNFLVRSGVNFDPPATLSYDGSQVAVTQTRKNLERVRNILRRYSDVKQVNIESKFIEVSQSTLNELTTNWQIVDNADPTNPAIRAQSQLRTLTSVFGVSAASRNGSIVAANPTTGAVTSQTQIPNTPPPIGGANFGNGQATFGGIGAGFDGRIGIIGQYNLNLFLRAVEQSSGSDLMSAPSLTVNDGNTAVIKIAQLLRYPQSYGDVQAVVSAGTQGGGGGNSVAITAGTPQDFTVQEVGVSLEVQPKVNEDTISLNVKPKVVEFEGFVEYGGTSVAISGSTTVSVPSGFFQPIFTTREVTTDVTVYDGATVVIGGLTREEVKSVDDKVPVLGDIPLIGAAFRSSGKTTSKRNLMVFVTANLVSPGGSTLRSSYPGMRAGSTFSNPVLASPGGAIYREPLETEAPVAAPKAPTAPPAN